MNDRAEFEDEALIGRFRRALTYDDPAAAQRLRDTLAGRAAGPQPSDGWFLRLLHDHAPLRQSRSRLTWMVLLGLLLLLASSAAVAGGNILDLGKPVDIQSTNAYFPLSGFHRAGPTLRQAGKPEVLFMGAQGPIDKISIERWPLVKALEQFGTFSGVKAVERGCTTEHGGYLNGQVQCSDPTFDLSRARFSSRYVAFVSKDLVRVVNNDTKRFQTLDPSETALYNRYVKFRGRPQCYKVTAPNHMVSYPCSTYVAYIQAAINSMSLRTLPLIAVGDYLQTVSQDLTPTDLTRTITFTPVPNMISSLGYSQGLPFDTVRQALATSHDPPGIDTLVTHVNAEANIITALICHADGRRPAGVCNRPTIKTILRSVK